MKNKFFYIAIYCLLFALMISCNHGNSVADTKTDSSAVSMKDSLIVIPEPADTNTVQKEVWERYVTDEGYTHLDPDTSLVLFMYTHYNAFDAQEQYEEYVRWDLEKESIQALYKELLAAKPDADSILLILNNNGEHFLTIMKTDLQRDFKQSKQYDSREFQYLLERQDPFVKPFLKMLIKDPEVSEEVRLEAEETLKDLAW